MKNVMSVDVEDYFQVSAFERVVQRDDWEQCESRVEVNTQRLLELFASKDIQATFFVLGWVAERYPSLVRSIAEAGHEIASHGYSHRLVYSQTPEVFREETLRSKELLEDITGQEVIGYRAASYSITEQSLWAIDILVELGFQYDSSIYPVFHDRYGIPGAEKTPHLYSTDTGSSIVELPLSVFDPLGLKLPVGGGGYFRLYPYWFTQFAMSWLNKRRERSAVFYLHPWEVDPDQPRINGSALSKFRHYNNLDRCYGRLEKLIETFEFTNAKNLLQQQGLLPSAAI